MSSSDLHPFAGSRTAGKFYYDGDCGLCSRVVSWLARLDFGKKISWIPFQSLERPPYGLSWEDLDRAAYLEAENGDLLEGFDAFRKLSLKIPWLWPLVPIFWLPGIGVPGWAVYRWVAENRHRFSRCTVPHRRRESDAPTPRDEC